MHSMGHIHGIVPVVLPVYCLIHTSNVLLDSVNGGQESTGPTETKWISRLYKMEDAETDNEKDL